VEDPSTSECVPDFSFNVNTVFENPSPGFSSCHHPTYHSERGAYFDGQSFLEMDNFAATTWHGVQMWVRPRRSGFLFHYNFSTRPYNYDRDLCDDWDDYHM
jgi:hypothetical protein